MKTQVSAAKNNTWALQWACRASTEDITATVHLQLALNVFRLIALAVGARSQ